MKTKTQFSGFLGMLILLMVVGCSSNDDTNDAESLPDYDYFLRYEVDGEVEEFTWDYDKKVWIAAALNSAEEGGNFFLANSSSLLRGISINLSTAEPIVIGETYTQEDIEYLLATYTNNGEFYTNGYAAVNSGFSSTDLEVIITEVSNGEIRGQFSGTFETTEEKAVSITDGEFFALLGSNEVPEQ